MEGCAGEEACGVLWCGSWGESEAGAGSYGGLICFGRCVIRDIGDRSSKGVGWIRE